MPTAEHDSFLVFVWPRANVMLWQECNAMCLGVGANRRCETCLLFWNLTCIDIRDAVKEKKRNYVGKILKQWIETDKSSLVAQNRQNTNPF